MVLLLHGFLLPCGMFEGSFYTFSMSQQVEKCREVFSLVMNAPAQFIKCGCSELSIPRRFPGFNHLPSADLSWAPFLLYNNWYQPYQTRSLGCPGAVSNSA